MASGKNIPPKTVQEMMRRSLYHIKWYFAKTDLNTDKGKAENKKSVVKYAKRYTPEKEAKSPREASEMFQCIKYEDKREVFGLKIHSFSTLDRIKKYDDSDNEENAEKPYSIKVGETKRTINLYAIATTKFQIAV